MKPINELNHPREEIIRVLRRAHEILQPDGAWTTGAYARDRTGKPSDPRGRDACSWCLDGAIIHAGGPTSYMRIIDVASLAEKTVEDYLKTQMKVQIPADSKGYYVIPYFNDCVADHAAVLKLLADVAKYVEDRGGLNERFA